MFVTEFPTQRKDGQVALVNYEVNNVENNASDNINDVVNDYVSYYKGSIHKNNGVHVGLAPINEGVTKDDGFSKRSDKKSKKKVENIKVVLNAKMTPSKNILTHTKANKIPKKKKKYVVVSKKSSTKKGMLLIIEEWLLKKNIILRH